MKTLNLLLIILIKMKWFYIKGGCSLPGSKLLILLKVGLSNKSLILYAKWELLHKDNILKQDFLDKKFMMMICTVPSNIFVHKIKMRVMMLQNYMQDCLNLHKIIQCGRSPLNLMIVILLLTYFGC